MNSTPGFGQPQPYPGGGVAALKRKLLPGMVLANFGALLAIIGSALPFISASYGGYTESQSIFSSAFSGGRTIAGVLLVVAFIFLFVPVLAAYFKPTPGQVKRSAIFSIIGGVIGVVTVLLMMFVFTTESGETVSSELSMIRDMGADAGFGIGTYIAILGFLIGGIGGVLFLMHAGPMEQALLAEQAQAMQNQPHGQPGQAPFQPGQPGQAPFQQGPPQPGQPHPGRPFNPGAPQPGQPGPQQPGQPGPQQGGWQQNPPQPPQSPQQ